MNNIDFIVFNFYIPMYGSGLFYFDKEEGEAGFRGIQEGTGEIIEDSTTITAETFDIILNFTSKELSSDNNPDKYFGCSIGLYSGEEQIELYDEHKIDYEKYSYILYSIMNEYVHDLSQYLW